MTASGAATFVGGFLGGVNGATAIVDVSDSFSIGSVSTTGVANYGGFIGGVSGGAVVTLNNNYFAADTIKAGIAPFVAGDCGGGFNNALECDYTSKASLQGNDTHPVFNVWDFGSTWQIVLGDYPDLQ